MTPELEADLLRELAEIEAESIGWLPLAHKMKQMVTEGGDPKVESHRFKDVPTFGDFVAERYLPYAKTRKRSWETDETMLRTRVRQLTT